jgi:hypothetical protein
MGLVVLVELMRAILPRHINEWFTLRHRPPNMVKREGSGTKKWPKQGPRTCRQICTFLRWLLLVFTSPEGTELYALSSTSISQGASKRKSKESLALTCHESRRRGNEFFDPSALFNGTSGIFNQQCSKCLPAYWENLPITAEMDHPTILFLVVRNSPWNHRCSHQFSNINWLENCTEFYIGAGCSIFETSESSISCRLWFYEQKYGCRSIATSTFIWHPLASQFYMNRKLPSYFRLIIYLGSTHLYLCKA